MQFSANFVAFLLLAAPALVSAAPAAEANLNRPDTRTAEIPGGSAAGEFDFTKRTGGEELFARQERCNAVRPGNNDKAGQKKYDDLQAKMSAATKLAHEGEKACPSTSRTDFSKSKDKKKREGIKTKCLNGYRQCVTQRKAANNACRSMGGDIDAGHLNAVTVCEGHRDYWNNQKP